MKITWAEVEERTRLTEGSPFVKRMLNELATIEEERNALRARVTELEADGRRYRFLKAHPDICRDLAQRDTGLLRWAFSPDTNTPIKNTPLIWGDSLDEAIDATMAEGEK